MLIAINGVTRLHCVELGSVTGCPVPACMYVHTFCTPVSPGGVVGDIAVHFLEPIGGDPEQQLGQLQLPLGAVADDRLFQAGAVQQRELTAYDRVLHLHVVGHLRVPAREVPRRLGSMSLFNHAVR